MDYHVNHDQKVAVSTTYFWREISTCPPGVKVLLLTDGGIAIVGPHQPSDGCTHWAPLPKRAPHEH